MNKCNYILALGACLLITQSYGHTEIALFGAPLNRFIAESNNEETRSYEDIRQELNTLKWQYWDCFVLGLGQGLVTQAAFGSVENPTWGVLIGGGLLPVSRSLLKKCRSNLWQTEVDDLGTIIPLIGGYGLGVVGMAVMQYCAQHKDVYPQDTHN